MIKKKIAILGGGLGALSTAYWLSESPNAAQNYDITIYQQGWRLGGKGASGRNLHADHGQRIEEHGLHIWFGFYENAFFMFRRVLKALKDLPQPPVSTFEDWRKAFKPHSLVVLGDNSDDGLEQWPILFPENDRRPGRGQNPSDWAMMLESLRLGINFFEGRFGDNDELADFLEGFALPDWATRRLWKFESLVWRNLLKTVHRIAKWLPDDPLQRDAKREQALALMLRGFRRLVREVLRHHVPQNARARRIYVVTDLLTTVAIGVLEDQLLHEGFETVDHLEFREWLLQHGADASMTLQSNITRVLYDLMFAYAQGREENANIAAGTGARTLLSVFSGYDGAIMYKMQSGMGDTIFTPLYGLLRARGVKFEFFHRVTRLEPGTSGEIEAVHLRRQVNLKPSVIASGGYQPLVNVKGYDCWPSTPLFDQIDNASALLKDPHNPGHPYDLESMWSAWPGVGTRVLKKGQDFDLVVNAIPVAGLNRIASELIPLSPTWQRMLQGPAPVATVRTQAMQLWMRRSAADDGWIPPERMQDAVDRGVCAPLLGGYMQPFNTWCDMHQVMPQETWPASNDPATVAYFCGQMPDDPNQPVHSDHGYPATQRAQVLATAQDWVRNAGPVLWPEAADPFQTSGMAVGTFIAPPGQDEFKGQYFRANIDPSERYTLSLAGTTTSRPPIHGPEFPNLYLAGDWTRNPVLNAGCVESTVASGMAVSRAICGFPKRIAGESEWYKKQA